jgi:short-subunit dehydrogenase
MDLNLKGRTAFVTGASHGIGKAIAAALAAEGVHLALFGRDIARCEALAHELRKTHDGLRVIVAALDAGRCCPQFQLSQKQACPVTKF